MSALDEANSALRDAVKARMDATPKDDPKMQGYVTEPLPEQFSAEDSEQSDTYAEWVPGFQPRQENKIPSDWILRGQRELQESETVAQPVALRGDSLIADNLRPGSREFIAVLDELRDLHLRKTMDYGVDEDALSNIRSSADIVNMPAWAGCVLRMMDKMHRLKAYFRRGRVEFDGLSDTFKDLACYAVIAEVLRREEQTP